MHFLIRMQRELRVLHHQDGLACKPKTCYCEVQDSYMKTVCLLSSGHLPEDERIFEKFSLSLKDNGFKVIIIQTTSDLQEIREGVEFDCFKAESAFLSKLSLVAARLKKHN